MDTGMSTGLRERCVVVTGAGTDVGRATAVRFAREGAYVLAADLRRAGADETVKAVADAGGTALAVIGDLSDQQVVDQVVDTAVDAFGGVDVLAHNAAITDRMSVVSETDDAEWYRVIEVNLTAPFLLTRAVLPHMMAEGRGSIVFTAAETGLRGSIAGAASTASRHGVVGTSGALGAVALALVLLLVPESTVRTGGRFDLIGSFGLAAGLISLLPAVSKGSDWGWTGAVTLGLLTTALLVLPAWGFYELRTARPLVDLRTTARRQVLFTNLASVAIGFSMFAMSLVLPQLLQLPEATGYGLGRSMLAVGLVLAPQGLVMMTMSAVSARLTRAKGPRTTLMYGSLVVAAGYSLSLVLMSEIWHITLVACTIGAGIGFAYGAMPALIMGAVPTSGTAAANSLNTLMRSLGTSFASALAGVVLAQMTTDFGGRALPSENGFKVVMGIGAGAALLSFALASFIPGGRTTGQETPAADGPTDAAEVGAAKV
ncbi:SDR family NAD(P)-dependent oxidoreductase [Streptomyces sp. NBC_01604]|uniref:SDR family NAD(P)-dependent oxidoreductase n=1 Tax=Streptomyces sp. NBC_01604 TaxID=2975894 RepID=UPI003866B242